MYHYDETKDLSFTKDENLARRTHVLIMLDARRYVLNPQAIGQLQKVLGPAPINISRQDALTRVRTALNEIGQSSLRIEDVISVVDNNWQLLLRAGN